MKDAVIVKLDGATRMLAEAKTMQQAKQIMDMADAARVYAKRQKLGEEAVSYANSIKIEAMRRLGEMWAQSPKNNGARAGGKKLSSRGPLSEPRDITPTLADLGLSKKIASVSQRLAKLPKREFEQVRDGIVGMAEALRQARVSKYEEKIKDARPGKVLESGPYELVLADPPWRYDVQQTPNRRIENHYATMDLDGIIKMAPNSAKDSILLLWATAPKLEEAMQVLKAWGFEYKTNAIWDKEVIGMGYWFRGQHELLLVGTKGNPGTTPESKRISSVFREKRTAHSKKPVSVYDWIEQAFPHKSKLEMYCRSPRKGWAAWGNEV